MEGEVETGSGLMTQGLDEALESCREFSITFCQSGGLAIGDEAQTLREVDEVPRFGNRARRDVEEIEILTRRTARGSFYDIRRNRYRRASELSLQSELLRQGKVIGGAVDLSRQAVC